MDFGTSNSSAARIVGGQPMAVREPVNQLPFFPSCVLLAPANGSVDIAERLITGTAAEARKLVFPDRFRSELKRDLGKDWPFLLGGEEVTVLDAVAAVMRSLKAEADKLSGGPFPKVRGPGVWGLSAPMGVQGATPPGLT